MTDKPTPTDAELNTILRTHWPAFARQSALVEIWVRDALQDAIDKLGPPDQKTVTVAPATGDMWLKHDDDLRYVRRVLEAGRQMTDVDQGAAIDMVQALRVASAINGSCDAKKPAQAAEPFGYVHQLPSGSEVFARTLDFYPNAVPVFTTPQPTHAQAGAVPLDEARRLFDAGWKAAALFCDREDVVADGIIGFGACPQFEAAFSAAQPVAREPLTDEQTKALMQAHRTAMLMTCKARVPECGEFSAIAQDLDWLCESFGIKGGQHG